MHHSASLTTSPAYDRKPSLYAWLVVAMLWFIGLLNYLDRLMITTMRDPIRADVRITDANFGMLTSVFLWVYAAASPFGGYLADRFGRRGVIIASLVCWSAATWVTGVAHTFEQLLASRALMGLSEACYIPAALALIADYHRGRTRSFANGLHMVGIYTGAVLGGVGGYLSEAFGWRWGFKVIGLVGVAYGVFMLFCLWDAPRQEDHALVADAAGEDIYNAGNELRTDGRPSGVLAIIASLFTSRGFVILVALNVLVGVCNWAIYGWLPTFLKQSFSLGLGAAGLSATVYIQVASFIGVLAAGALADYLSRNSPRARALVPAVGYLLAGPCLFLAASTNFLPTAIFGLIVFGLGRGAYDANLMPILRELIDERFSATGYGILNFLGTAAGGIMVYVGGAMLDAKIDLARVFQGCGICLFFVSVLLWVLRFPRPGLPIPDSAVVPEQAAAAIARPAN